MPLGADTDFTSDELALIPKPSAEELQAMQEENEAPPAQPSSTSEGSTTETGQASETPAATAAAAPAPADSRNPGDLRAALRASRRAEQRAREEARRLAEEVSSLREKVGKEPNPDELTDEEIEAAAVDFPLLAKVAKLARSSATTTAASAQEQNTGEGQEFTPPALPVEYQDAVDQVPDMLSWQLNPDQTAWEAAKRMDTYVLTLPGWADKPLAERFAEVARRIKADIGASSQATTQRIDPTKAIEAAPRAAPSTLSDLGGGGATKPASNLDRYARMSDDEIVADLARS